MLINYKFKVWCGTCGESVPREKIKEYRCPRCGGIVRDRPKNRNRRNKHE